MDKKELIEQTKLAFDLIQKLYFEVSYLVKEVEGQLGVEDEQFQIGRPSGYGITARGSNGLEPTNVNNWPMRKFSVFFAPKEKMVKDQATTVTKFTNDLRVIYMRVLLNDKDLHEPKIYIGALWDIEKKSAVAKNPTKFENVMASLEYSGSGLWAYLPKLAYVDTNVKFKGWLLTKDLFDINNSEEIRKSLVDPALKLFRNADLDKE